jgi:hypothetical protein
MYTHVAAVFRGAIMKRLLSIKTNIVCTIKLAYAAVLVRLCPVATKYQQTESPGGKEAEEVSSPFVVGVRIYQLS